MASDRDDLEELIDPPRITDKSVGYITSILSTSPSSELDNIDGAEGKATLRFSGDVGFRISSDSHPPIVYVDTTVDGVVMTFDLTKPIDQIGGRLDTETCPECEAELEMWAAGDMGEQMVCPDCDARYIINSATFLERVG